MLQVSRIRLRCASWAVGWSTGVSYTHGWQTVTAGAQALTWTQQGQLATDTTAYLGDTELHFVTGVTSDRAADLPSTGLRSPGATVQQRSPGWTPIRTAPANRTGAEPAHRGNHRRYFDPGHAAREEAAAVAIAERGPALYRRLESGWGRCCDSGSDVRVIEHGAFNQVVSPK
jgi:hypothetical protein